MKEKDACYVYLGSRGVDKGEAALASILDDNKKNNDDNNNDNP